ncbi:MAG: TrmH family RNA methyltransferase [Sphingobacteriaceae bacterium]
MLSKSQISFLKSLKQKKFRKEHALFLVEGQKSVKEFIASAYEVDTVYHAEPDAPKLLKLSHNIKSQHVSLNDLDRISNLSSPQAICATIKIPNWPTLKPADLRKKFSLVLDGIQDPGNMGTIIRTADWFGINQIICSEDTAEAYNPKVVQATMGSLCRIKFHYTPLPAFLEQAGLPIFGTLLAGHNIFKIDFGEEGLIVMGNEGHGIREDVRRMVQKAVTIPKFGEAESLNVAVATAIICAQLHANNFS